MLDNHRIKGYSQSNCNHLACSEIRAANLSGVCSDSYTYFNMMRSGTHNYRLNENCIKNHSFQNMVKYYDHCKGKIILLKL